VTGFRLREPRGEGFQKITNFSEGTVEKRADEPLATNERKGQPLSSSGSRRAHGAFPAVEAEGVKRGAREVVLGMAGGDWEPSTA